MLKIDPSKIFLELLKQLDKLNLPADKYAITSSGPMAVRGIREANDIDIVAEDELFDNLALKHGVEERDLCSIIHINNIDILGKFKFNEPKYSTENQIKQADILLGKKFVNLEVIIYFKNQMKREKDLKDIELIKQYLKENSDLV